jgi:alkanesulfonate monooxygenase SsuD/methylene tetrahydromethanopterin reductase-like flavin-dependent oxidoreductase (luciferase family)
MPARNVVPKPVQRPHPPLWTACSNRRTIVRAARHGMGALTFSFVTPEEASAWVGEYHRALAEECVPLGRTVNARIAMVTGFGCHEDADEARNRFKDGLDFFGYALGHYYAFGRHVPGRSDIWSDFVAGRGGRGLGDATPFDTPEGLRRRYRTYEQAGVDQAILMPQGGRNRHEDICEALELFGREVLPEFLDRHPAAEARRQARLAPVIEAAMQRAATVEEPAPPDVVEAYGLRSERTRREVAAVLYEDQQ